MKSNEFMILRLNEVFKLFDTKNIVYGIDEIDDTHIVYLSAELLDNPDFQKLEEEILFDFIDKYPDEGLFFTSEKRYIENVTIRYLGTILRMDESVQKLKGIYDKVIGELSLVTSTLSNKKYFLTPKGIISSPDVWDRKPLDEKGYEYKYPECSNPVMCEEQLGEYSKI